MSIFFQQFCFVSGIFWAPYPQWKTLRTFTISSLKEEGMGKATMETRVLEEIEHYISHFLKPKLGKPFSVTHNIAQATCNITSQMLFGKRFDYNDEKFNKMIEAINEILSLLIKVALMENLPVINRLSKSTIHLYLIEMNICEVK